jgi:hypothetical protein
MANVFHNMYVLTIKGASNPIHMEAESFHNWVSIQGETVGHSFKTRLAQLQRYFDANENLKITDWELDVE